MPTELDGFEGSLPEGRIAIAVSRYNASITENLLQGAVSTLTSGGVADARIDIVRVPGAWELPLVAGQLARRASTAAIIVLGAVIRGETTHDEHINRAVSTALMDLALETSKPVLFGLLTCNTVEQAIHRSGGNVGNKGSECAEAALEMLRLMHKLG